jgi:hypothetical protein
MSQQRSKSFFREYARSGYEGKMNPEFDGIARKYYKEKKEHEKVHTLKAKLDKEVAFMERMERKMEQHLHKKQNELRYAKEVSSRFQNDLRRVTHPPRSASGLTSSTPRRSRTTSRRPQSSNPSQRCDSRRRRTTYASKSDRWPR